MFNQEIVDVPSRDALIPATAVFPSVVGDAPFAVLAHGFCGSRDEKTGFAEIAHKLAERGIASIRPDFAGGGDSRESFLEYTMANTAADVAACVEYMLGRSGIRDRVGIIGNSLGARTVLEYLARGGRCDAVCLLSPAAANRGQFAAFSGEENFLKMREIAERDGSCPYRTFSGGEVPLSPVLFCELYDVDAISKIKPLVGRSLVIYAADDEVVPAAISRRVADAFGAKLVECTGGGHTLGFYSMRPDIQSRAADETAEFIAGTL